MIDTRRFFRLLFCATWPLILSPEICPAQPLPSRVVAYSGQVAPGTATFFDSLSRPAIGANGEIAFRGRLDQALPGGSNRDGIWMDVDGVLTELYLSGEVISGEGSLHDRFVDPTVNAEGRIVFGSRLVDSGAFDAVWVERTDTGFPDPFLYLALSEGQAAPGVANAYIGGFQTGFVNEHYLLDDQGFTLIMTPFRNLAGQALGSGLVLSDGDRTDVVMAPGDPVPGVAGAVFTGVIDAVLSPQTVFAYVASIQMPGGESEQVLVRSRRLGPGNYETTKVVRTGESPVGISGDKTLASLMDLRINADGSVVFISSVENMSHSVIGAGMWLAPAADLLTMLVDPEAQPVAIGTARSLALVDSGAILVSGLELPSADPGIFEIGGGGGVGTRFAAGQPAPGIPGAVFDDFGPLVTNRHGRLAFSATLSGSGVDFSNGEALFAEDDQGALRLVARQGDVITLATSDQRTISGLSLTDGTRGTGGFDGRPGGFSDRGEFVWRANFSDGGIAILVTDLGVEARPELVGLEVIQTIQSWENSVALIEDKPTLVRAHLQTQATPLQADLVLSARDLDGLEVGELLPVNKPLIDDVVSRGQLEDSYNWYLPSSWLKGDLILSVERRDGDLLCSEPDQTPDDCEIDAFFSEPKTMDLRVIAVGQNQGGVTQRISRSERVDLVQRLESAFPVSEINWEDSEIPAGATADSLQDLLELGRSMSIAECATQPCETRYLVVARGPAAEGLVSGRVVAAFLPAPNLRAGAHHHSHLLAQSLGLHQSVHSLFGPAPNGDKRGACGELASPGAADYPDLFQVDIGPSSEARPTLGPMDAGEASKIYGFDAVNERILSPDRVFDLLSLCSTVPADRWSSRSTYAELRQRLPGPTSSLAGPSLGSTTEFLVVRGSVDSTSGSVTLRPLQTSLGAAMPAPPDPGSHLLRVHRVGGALEEISFEPRSVKAVGVQDSIAVFDVPIAQTPEIDRLEIWHQGLLMASRIATRPPRVEVLSPNGGELLDAAQVTISWSASDPDGDPITHMIQLSTDGGTTWRTLAANWNGSSITLSRESLPRTDLGLIRVISSDGLSSSVDVSDATFTLANSVPHVEVVTPAASSSYFVGESVVLTARGFDTEDGNLPGSAFTWASNIEGPLGSGAQLMLDASSLAAGYHLIEVTATDSHGSVATASRAVAIEVHPIFSNGFEQGNTSAWSVTAGSP